jgi:hypothetical protein
LIIPWAKNVKYESEACFTADSSGIPDLSKQKPDSGSYEFIDSMGLVLSLKIAIPSGRAYQRYSCL